MSLIDNEWLKARGSLHDARLVSALRCGPNLEIAIDDEWVNDRGLTLPQEEKSPGLMVLENATLVQGHPAKAVGGWISEVELRGAAIHFHFTNRDPLTLKASAARWRGSPEWLA